MELKEVLEKGQYRDVWYIEKDGTEVEKRCLIIPATAIEPLTENKIDTNEALSKMSPEMKDYIDREVVNL